MLYGWSRVKQFAEVSWFEGSVYAGLSEFPLYKVRQDYRECLTNIT